MQEQHLIKQAQDGVTSSFSQLVALYQARLYQFLFARCHSKQDAEDVLQETFISAFKYIKSYKPDWKFSTWLFTIAKRLIKKQTHLYYQLNYDVENQISSEANAYSNPVDKDNIWVHIKEILKHDAYDVLWFFYVEQFSIKEIANISQHSQSWVKISLYRSKKKLLNNKIIQNISEDFI